MTKAEFRELTLQIARGFGRGIPSDPAVIDGVVRERLRKFTETTRCLYDMDVQVSLTAGVAEYSLEGSAFSKPMADVDALWIDGAKLPRHEPSEFADFYANVIGTQGPPVAYAMMPGKLVRFAPVPDQAYTGRAVGPRLHRNLTAGPEGDEEQIEIPTASLRTAAAFCAVALAFPHAVGRNDVELLQMVDQAAAADIAKLRNDSIRLRHGRMVRGARNKPVWYDLS